MLDTFILCNGTTYYLFCSKKHNEAAKRIYVDEWEMIETSKLRLVSVFRPLSLNNLQTVEPLVCGTFHIARLGVLVLGDGSFQQFTGSADILDVSSILVYFTATIGSN